MTSLAVRSLPLALILAGCGASRGMVDSLPDLDEKQASTEASEASQVSVDSLDGRDLEMAPPVEAEEPLLDMVAEHEPLAGAEAQAEDGDVRMARPSRDRTLRAEARPQPTSQAAPVGYGRGGGVGTRSAEVGTIGFSEPAPGRPLPMRRTRPGPPHQAPSPHVNRPSAPVPATQSSEQYTDYGVRGFKFTDDDDMATFSIDVDTASYTITRRKLRQGHLPPTSAVRVEEFVNYFPYEYAQPAKGEPFAVDVEAAPSPYASKNVLMRVGVQGRHVTYDQRKPVNLTFLVDVSGSMRGEDRIELVKKSILMLSDELEDGDTLSIATYAAGSRVVLDPTPVSQRAAIQAAVNQLHASGSTAMSSGIELAYGLAEKSYQPGSVNRVIIASDGDANVGQTSHSALSDMIRGHADRGITLTTLGFGNGNYKDTMMERLANDGDGNYYYIDSLQESRRLFVDKLSSTLENIAKDVKLQVHFDPSKVRAWRLVGYENRHLQHRDFRDDKVDAGEIGSGHQVTALFELQLEDGARGKLGEMRVRSKAPGPDSPSVERSFGLNVGEIPAQFDDASRQFRIQTAVAGFAEILRNSPNMGEISLTEVLAIAREARRAEYPEDAELVELIGQAAKLRGEGAVTRR